MKLSFRPSLDRMQDGPTRLTCLTPYHTACSAEFGGCPTLGCGRRVTSTRPLRVQRGIPNALVREGEEFIGQIVLGAVVLLILTPGAVLALAWVVDTLRRTS